MGIATERGPARTIGSILTEGPGYAMDTRRTPTSRLLGEPSYKPETIPPRDQVDGTAYLPAAGTLASSSSNQFTTTVGSGRPALMSMTSLSTRKRMPSVEIAKGRP